MGDQTEEPGAVIIRIMNEKTGKSFRYRHPNGEITSNGKLIQSLIRKGYSSEDLQRVFWRKYREWWDDDKMARFIRPATLYAPGNFDQYIGELESEGEYDEL